MKLCDNKHTEIVYIGYSCPLCDAEDKIIDNEKEIERLNHIIGEMEYEAKP